MATAFGRNKQSDGGSLKVDVFCNRNKNKVLISLIILESNICDESFLSEGLMSERGLCLEGVIYRGGFVLYRYLILNQ